MHERKITSFELTNYKSFDNTGEISIQGLNILLGPNSSGKSNILESLLLLKQSVESKEFGGLVLNGDLISLGEYKDVIHLREEHRSLGYRFNFTEENQDPNEGKEYSCPLCSKDYTYKGYYTNHLEDKHPDFYQNGKVDLRLFEEFEGKDPYIDFSYKLDQESRSIVLDEFIYGNPPPIDGLFLSTLEFQRSDQGIYFKANDIHGNEAFKFLFGKTSSVEEIRVNNFTELSDFYRSTIKEGAERIRNKSESSLNMLGRSSREGQAQDYARLGESDHNFNKVFEVINTGGDVFEVSNLNMPRFNGLLNRLSTLFRQQDAIITDLENFLSPLSHVGPLRENPERIYFGAGGDPETVGEKGQNIPNILFKDKQARGSELTERTNEWLQESGFDCQIDVSEVGVGDMYQLEVLEDGLSVNLADTGFGLSQILPIIIECIRLEIKQANDDEQSTWTMLQDGMFRVGRQQNKTYLNLIEQPEIHLNPQMHADVSEFFIETVDSGINLIVETHSEHILTRVQRRVADDTIEDEENVTIYFVSKNGKSSKIEEINISETGEFSNWPDGFFEDDFEDAMAILEESIEKKKGE